MKSAPAGLRGAGSLSAGASGRSVRFSVRTRAAVGRNEPAGQWLVCRTGTADNGECDGDPGRRGLTLTDVVKITVYLSDLDRVHEFNQLYVEYFEEHRPARTLVQVGLRNIEIELDIIAMDMQDATLPQGRSRRHGE